MEIFTVNIVIYVNNWDGDVTCPILLIPFYTLLASLISVLQK